MMPVAISAAQPIAGAALARLLLHVWGEAKPSVLESLGDPAATVSRFGDWLVWSGPTGTEVIGGIETLGDSVARIDSAVLGIESAQLSMQGVLGVVESISIATLGLTSLSAAFMAFRMQSINRRVAEVAKRTADVEGKIDAQHKAHLKSSLQFLREFDDSDGGTEKLNRALDEARLAANIYGEVAAEEASRSKPRLHVLNCRGRLQVISLLTELRCLMLADKADRAIERIDDEHEAMRNIARVCFDQTLSRDPERYLRAAFQPHGVTLDLLTNVYQQARLLEVVDEPVIADASSMFEHLRSRNQRGMLKGLRKSALKSDLINLRYLLACLEETSKLSGLRLMISKAKSSGASLSELIAKLNEWKARQAKQETEGAAPQVFAYPL